LQEITYLYRIDLCTDHQKKPEVTKKYLKSGRDLMENTIFRRYCDKNRIFGIIVIIFIVKHIILKYS
jgi:hypothetical protein